MRPISRNSVWNTAAQVLRNGLVGQHARCIMIATASPSSTHAEHTLNTLRYAERLKETG